MKYSLALFLVAAVCLLPGLCLEVWNTANDYMSFAVIKSCLGEELAVQMQRKGTFLGRECLQKLESEPESQHTRNRRNILKMPPNPSVGLQMCNMKAWDMLSGDGTIQFEKVEAFFRNVSHDQTLQDDFLQLSLSCKTSSPPTAGLQEDQIYIAVVSYLRCLNAGGLKACMDYEHRRYFNDL
ncbi:uncharacterized protein LOC125046043 [Penaeus chinensis]|uniref:uncharacterized protein LOC125046043 n=1 Tax=Penaeus chinensis TaxID=139456 RepID=UPI001FB8306A|nr:uncharacterized protein LOC125046043 [Penaeus chinensis]XP_047499604.1 uncharacterized protein LOC125046043 [Penaeus chinensis]